MSSNRRLPRRRISIGVAASLVGAAGLGLAYTNLSTASAATAIGKITIINDSIPAGTKSVKMAFDTGDFACFASDFSDASNLTETRSTAFQDQQVDITAHTDSGCTSSTSVTKAFKFTANDPNGCEQVRVALDTGIVEFNNCALAG